MALAESTTAPWLAPARVSMTVAAMSRSVRQNRSRLRRSSLPTSSQAQVARLGAILSAMAAAGCPAAMMASARNLAVSEVRVAAATPATPSFRPSTRPTSKVMCSRFEPTSTASTLRTLRWPISQPVSTALSSQGRALQ